MQAAERCRRVRLLLGSLNDPYPCPRDSVGSLAGHLGGPAPGRRVPCAYCLRTGRRASGRICPACEGIGWRRRRKGEDAFDEYTGEPVVTSASGREHVAPFRLADDYRRLGAQLERVNREVEAREGSRSASYGWERAREAQERLGSYRELRTALSGLQQAHEDAYGVVRAVWLRGIPVVTSDYIAALEQTAVFWLQKAIPGEVRVPPWLLVEVHRERKLTFAEMVNAGRSSAEIARALNLSRKSVRRRMRELLLTVPAAA